LSSGLVRLDAGRERGVGRTGLLDGVANLDVAAVVARDGALDQDQAALDVDLPDGDVERGDGFLTQVTGHLLARERTARILAVTGRTVRTVRDRNTVGGAETTEVPALHGAGETLTDGDALITDCP